jgi:hypothetical protein
VAVFVWDFSIKEEYKMFHFILMCQIKAGDFPIIMHKNFHVLLTTN